MYRHFLDRECESISHPYLVPKRSNSAGFYRDIIKNQLLYSLTLLLEYYLGNSSNRLIDRGRRGLQRMKVTESFREDSAHLSDLGGFIILMSTSTSVSVGSDTPESVSVSPEASPEPLGRDEIFHLLQNQRRRLVLRYLTEHAAVEMREVAEQVAAWENDTTVEGLTSDARQRVYIALYQSHLPKLDESGVIEYDRNRGTIEPCAPLEQLEPYLSAATDEADGDTTWQWNDLYLGLAVFSVLSVLFVSLYFSVNGPGFWLSAIIAGVFGTSALIQRL